MRGKREGLSGSKMKVRKIFLAKSGRYVRLFLDESHIIMYDRNTNVWRNEK